MTEPRDVCDNCGNDAWIVVESSPPLCESCYAERERDQAHSEPCRVCGTKDNPAGGDGWDGMCSNCADKADADAQS